MLIMVPLSADDVPKKLKQNVNTVRILTLLVAFQGGSIHAISPIMWGTITKLGCAGPPAPASSRHWTWCNWVNRCPQEIGEGIAQYTLLSSSLLQQESKTYSYIENCWGIGSTGTISRFGERFRAGQYNLVTFVFLFLYSRCPPCPVLCKSGGTCRRALWSRRHFRGTVLHQEAL